MCGVFYRLSACVITVRLQRFPRFTTNFAFLIGWSRSRGIVYLAFCCSCLCASMSSTLWWTQVANKQIINLRSRRRSCCYWMVPLRLQKNTVSGRGNVKRLMSVLCAADNVSHYKQAKVSQRKYTPMCMAPMPGPAMCAHARRKSGIIIHARLPVGMIKVLPTSIHFLELWSKWIGYVVILFIVLLK